MRILGQIPHPNLNITVLKSGNKFLVKFEIGPFEQTYKFVESNKLSNFEDIKLLIDDLLLKNIFGIFDQMNLQYQSISSKTD